MRAKSKKISGGCFQRETFAYHLMQTLIFFAGIYLKWSALTFKGISCKVSQKNSFSSKYRECLAASNKTLIFLELSKTSLFFLL